MKKSTPSTWLRRLAAVSLALELALSLGVSALAADTATGADMRLTATEGTVTLKNSSGKALSVRDDMKLYSGYVLTTAAKSYAYVTLDSTKVVKLDANTKVEVRKSGSKLELLVSAGKLFFNVKAPLSSSESLNIRTSTMVTGIRGTSGLVDVLDQETSAVSIYDGTVAVTTANAVAQGGFQTTTVAAGQTGTTLSVGNGSWQTNLDDMTEDDIPGFVGVEIQKDPDLQQRIAGDTDLHVDDISAGAQERLAADEAAAQAQLDRIADAAGKLPNQANQAAQFAAPEPEPDWTPAPDPTPDPTPSTPDDGKHHMSGAITGSDLKTLLDAYGNASIDIVIDSGTVTIDNTVSVSSGQSLTIASGVTVTITGILGSYGSITNSGTIENSGYFNNYGSFTNSGTFTNQSGGEFYSYSSQYSTATVTNDGTITNGGSFYNGIQSGSYSATLTNNGTINNNKTITNYGTINNNSDATITNNSDATITNYSNGTITNYSTINNNSGATITNNGTINGSGTIKNNSGTISGSGTNDNDVQVGGTNPGSDGDSTP